LLLLASYQILIHTLDSNGLAVCERKTHFPIAPRTSDGYASIF